jgi:hypothetical protein
MTLLHPLKRFIIFSFYFYVFIHFNSNYLHFFKIQILSFQSSNFSLFSFFFIVKWFLLSITSFMTLWQGCNICLLNQNRCVVKSLFCIFFCNVDIYFFSVNVHFVVYHFVLNLKTQNLHHSLTQVFLPILLFNILLIYYKFNSVFMK